MQTAILTKVDILTYLDRHKMELRDRFGVIKIGLFGSFTRDEQHIDSDIDIAIEMQKEKKIFIIFSHSKESWR